MRELVISPLLVLRWRAGKLILGTPGGELRAGRDAAVLLEALRLFERPRSIEAALEKIAGGRRARARALLERLERHGALVKADGQQRRRSRQPRRGLEWWEWHDALFHLESRRAPHEHSEPSPGAVPLPAVKPAVSKAAVSLPVDVEIPDFSLREC